MISTFTLLFTLLWLLLPFGAWCLHRKVWRSKLALAGVFVLAVVAGSLLYVGGIWLLGKAYAADLDRYDLNNDGEFSPEEYTPQAQAAMKRLTNDTGRTLAPRVAGPATLIWTTANFLIFALIGWIWRAILRWRSKNAVF